MSLRTIVSTFLMVVLCQSFAFGQHETPFYDREVFVDNGIAYCIVDEKNKQVEVAFNAEQYKYTWVSEDYHPTMEMTNNYAGITELIIPDTVSYKGIKYTVTGIYNFAFSFSEIKSITLPKTITTINPDAFYECSSIEEVVIHDLDAWFKIFFRENGYYEQSVTITSTYYSNPLQNASRLIVNGQVVSDIVVPEDVTEIPAHIFMGYKGLKSIKLHEGITSIGKGAFEGCTNLIVDVPSLEFWCNLHSSGDWVMGPFSLLINGSEVENLTIPVGSTQISSRVFNHCTNIREVVFPETLTTIGYDAFYDCKSLECIKLPSSLTRIYPGAFVGCDNLKEIYYEANPDYFAVSGEYRLYEYPGLAYKNYFSFSEASKMLGTLHVPAGCKETAKKCYEWADFINVDEAFAPVESLELQPTQLTIQKGHQAPITPVFVPYYSTNKELTWTSSNEQVATVNAQGVVTAVGQGEVSITAATTDGSNLSATCKVSVIPEQVALIELNTQHEDIHINDEFQLVATVLPETAANRTIIWVSTNPAVVTVNQNGLVKAVGAGSATVSASSTDGSNLSASCGFDVTVIPITSLSLNLIETNLKRGEATKLVAYIYPANASFPNVAWMSSDSRIATVDQDGVVRAIAAGTAIITANTMDGSYLKATCRVNVDGYTPGDINGDGKIDITDVNIVIDVLLGKTLNALHIQRSDLNFDGKIDVTDVNMLIDMVLGRSSTL